MSTSWYAKIDAGFHANRKARKAGRLGREVFVFVLCQNASRGMTGSIPADDLEPWYLAEQLQMTEVEASEGVQRAKDAGLFEVDEELVTISGWNEEWGKRPLSGAERQQRRRDRTSNVTNHEGAVTSNEPNVTSNGQSDASRRKGSRKGSRKEGRDGEDRAVALPSIRELRPSPDTAQIAQDRGLSLEHELAQFRDHCASTGKKSRDWDAELRKWLRRSDGRGAQTPAKPTPVRPAEPSVSYQRTALNPSHFHEVHDGEVKRVVERAADGGWVEVQP